MSSRVARRTGLAPIVIRGVEYPDRGYCYDDGYDGPTIHTVYCRHDADATYVSSSSCIRHDQDGPAIAAERATKADERRFTPPEFRTPGSKPPKRKPGPVIHATQGQVTEVVALRGRPRTADDSGEWATWETFTEVDPDYEGPRQAAFLHEIPKHLTKKQARAIVAEFTARVPHYEFQVVHAWLSIEENVLA